MATNYVHTITEIEAACGVTMADVQRVLPLGAFFGDNFAIPANTSPALAGSVARVAFGGAAEFVGISKATGYLLFRVVH